MVFGGAYLLAPVSKDNCDRVVVALQFIKKKAIKISEHLQMKVAVTLVTAALDKDERHR